MTKRTRAANATALPADSHPDRRTLLTSAGAAAALIASTAPGVLAAPAASADPPVDPDAALWALREEWTRNRQAYSEALDHRKIVEARMFARCPHYPELVSWCGSLESFNAEVVRTKAERDRIEREEGYPEAERRDALACAADTAVVARIADTPARTIAGLAFKVHVSADWDHDNADLTLSIMEDLSAFATAHPTLAL